jgi:hypothetical protein
VQASNAGGLRAPRGPRVAFVLACWALGALVFTALPTATGRFVAANVIYGAAAAFAVVSLARVGFSTRGRERLFWWLLGAGLLVSLAGDWAGVGSRGPRSRRKTSPTST